MYILKKRLCIFSINLFLQSIKLCNILDMMECHAANDKSLEYIDIDIYTKNTINMEVFSFKTLYKYIWDFASKMFKKST